METKVWEHQGFQYAMVTNARGLIMDALSALELIVNVRYQTGCDRIALPKEAFAQTFFVLSTGLAGEVLQKFVNYRMRIAIIGDFSTYKSIPLQDFIGECNRGREIFFVLTQEEAAKRLCTR